MLNDNVTSALLALIQSENLCKLLSNDSDNPIDIDPLPEPSDLINTHIFPFPKFPSTTTKTGSFINIIFDDFMLGDVVSVKEGMVDFNVIVHNDLWYLNGGKLRPFMILTEIDKIFNNKRVFGLKKLQFHRGKFIIYNEDFSGYRVSYKLVNEN